MPSIFCGPRDADAKAGAAAWNVMEEPVEHAPEPVSYTHLGEVIVSMKDIVKTFPGVKALDHVNFELRSGEVMALLGENGAGKSTLMKILSGVYTKDSGTMTIFGTEYENLCRFRFHLPVI